MTVCSKGYSSVGRAIANKTGLGSLMYIWTKIILLWGKGAGVMGAVPPGPQMQMETVQHPQLRLLTELKELCQSCSG